LDKIATSLWDNDKKEIAKRLKDKLTYLQPGSVAPDFILTDFEGKTHKLSDFEGKYVYLDFTRVANPICRQHLDQLKKSAPNLENKLTIINLIMPEEVSKKDLILQQNWPGTFYIVDEKTADAYKVASFPMAYLISPKRELVFSPAPNPLDGFEQRFINLLKQKHIQELRNQAK
jgi:peroxiredoxin